MKLKLKRAIALLSVVVVTAISPLQILAQTETNVSDSQVVYTETIETTEETLVNESEAVTDSQTGDSGEVAESTESDTIVYDESVDNYATVSTEETTVDSKKAEISVSYAAYMQTYEWLETVSDGELAGKLDQTKRVESIRAQISGIDGLGIRYQAYVQDSGWTDWGEDGAEVGTTGQAKYIEAIKVELTGDNASEYDVYYRVYVDEFGWTSWAENGQESGSNGLSEMVRAYEILVTDKETNMPDDGEDSVVGAYLTMPSISYTTHQQTYGWNASVQDGATSGVIGASKRIEAYTVSTSDTGFDIGLKYRAYCQSYGWRPYVTEGQSAGTTGEYKRVEAIQIDLTGEYAELFEVYYRVHVRKLGWLDWAKNGETAGTMSMYLQIEAIQIVLVRTGAGTSYDTDNPMYDAPVVNYTAHQQTYGWSSTVAASNYDVSDVSICGVTGQAKQLEAVKLSVAGTTEDIGIEYMVHSQGYGWMSWVSDGGTAGTTGQNKRLEAIRIQLTGDDADRYDVYYRVHSQTYGWMGWAKNGEKAGTVGLAKRIEAIQVVIVVKGSAAPGSTSNRYKALEFDGIDVSKWQGVVNWSDVAASGIDFAMVRILHGSYDEYYKKNLSGAANAGIKTGAYCYCLATTVAEARDEANKMVEALKGYDIKYPVAYDIESSAYLGQLTPSEISSIIITFKNIVEAAGYDFILYANIYWLKNKIDMSKLSGVDIWVARYTYDNTKDPFENSGFETDNMTMWQYSDSGRVNGISGNVDLDVSYKDYN